MLSVSARIITAGLDSHFHENTVFQCYTPTNAAPENEKIAFYDVLQATKNKEPRSDVIIVGEDNNGREENMEKHEREWTAPRNNLCSRQSGD